jgi:hypothetical protein
MRRIIAAAATMPFLHFEGFGAGLPSAGLLTDPDLHKKIVPWERVLTEAELETVTALCDLIIPADEHSQAASAVGVPDFINEWVSAPFAQQAADLREIRAGLTWLDQESKKRFHRNRFVQLDARQQHAICDDIRHEPTAASAHKTAAAFFSKMRDLTAGGFYTTPEGWKDLGYVGNVPLAEFPGPPPEVLKHLGLG